jgi:glucosamine-6-phosphate deaminase
MEVIIQPCADAAALLTARLIVARLRAAPDLVLGLATGRTMERVYAHLVRLQREEDLDFSLCRTFNLDEYVGLPPEHPCSYRHYMQTKLFAHINIPRMHTHLPDGTAPDLAAECCAYEQRIHDAGGIGVQLLGMGVVGHIGFNEPLSAMQSRTREKALTPQTREQNKDLFGGDREQVPPRALTMGVGTILDAREVLMLVTGAAKARILAAAIEGPITAMISATALQLHPNCKVIVDEAAAVHLKGQEYYRWVFQHEPEWQEFREL